MVTIKVIPSIDLNFGAPINELLRVWAEIIKNQEQAIVLDFSGCRFSNPFFLLGVYLLYRHCKSDGMDIELNLNCGNEYFANYLNLTYFRGGFQPDTEFQDIETIFDSYVNKTYLPLTNFPAGANSHDSDIRDKLLGFMSNRVRVRLGLNAQLYSAVTYLIDEAVNNIKDHSRTDRGYLFTQFYPKKEYLDLCIADTGISLLGSYQSVGRNDILTDEEAIQAAISGDSTKDDPNRGFGIRTSRRMLINGLGGRYFLFSGNSFLFSRPGIEDAINVLPAMPGIRWPGTYIAMRIPVQRNANFNYLNYVE